MLIYLNALIPIAIKTIVPDGRYGAVTLIVDFLVLPFFLVILNVYLLQTKTEDSLLKCFLFMTAGLLLGNLIGYVIWGITSKMLMSPDAETIHISQVVALYHIAVCVMFGIVYKIVLMMPRR